MASLSCAGSPSKEPAAPRGDAATIELGSAPGAVALYGHKGCDRGYLVDLIDYVPYVSDPSAPSWPASVQCDEGLPATKSECERLQVVTYVWERTGKSTTYVGSSAEWATWNGNNCVNALIFLNSLDVTEGDDLRLASACRKHDVANDPSSPYSRQMLRFDL